LPNLVGAPIYFGGIAGKLYNEIMGIPAKFRLIRKEQITIRPEKTVDDLVAAVR
jgi:hypothetical protein